jgi:hypothetical protein
MKRKTVVLLLLGLLLSLTLSLSAPSAFAHSTPGCSHTHAGRHIPYNFVAHFWYSFWEKSWHFHVYKHYGIGNMWEHYYVHDHQKVCPGH